MEKKLTQQAFYDKVYAGWIGKNIGGTLGGPLEGIMELLDVTGYTQSFVEPMENDDLDLQLVSLHALEQYGGNINAELLAREWVSHVHFQYDEYGHSLTNMRGGMHTPLSGAYNNFFTDCMGSPIRSELWGMVCQGNPDLAAYFALQDATVDHAGGEGVHGEIFFAVFESLAFTCDDIPQLIERSLAYLPEDSRVRQAVACLLECHRKGLSWQQNRQALIDQFGSENFTDAPLNIAFTLMGLLYGTGFTERLLITTNCGYDTDCTCATIASMMGILYGPDYIDACWTEPLGERILVSPPVNGFRAPADIRELTERTVAVKALVDAQYQAGDKAAYALDFTADSECHKLPRESVRDEELRCVVRYQDGHPAIQPDEEKQVTMTLTNLRPSPRVLRLCADVGAGLESLTESQELTLAAGASSECTFTLKAVEKMVRYNAAIRMTTMVGALAWSEDCIPLSLVPTQDWRIAADEGEKECFCPTSKLDIPDAWWRGGFTAETALTVASDCDARLIVICSSGIKLELDGEKVAECDEYTPCIPAYHRADARKYANVRLAKGQHQIKITVTGGKNTSGIFFYVVDPNAHCAAIKACVYYMPQ